jgi:hypothetical protein
LFGDGSYKIKSEELPDGNFVPSYHSLNSLSPVNSYVSDDYFCLLDDGEDMIFGLLDLGVGRLPVSSPDQADAMVNKIISYENPDKHGDWRNTICFIGDDEDYNLHFNQANQLATYVESNYPSFNVSKIYLDAYKQISTPVGPRYPDVNKAITQQVSGGALIVNYTGHGGTNGLAHEKILEVSDINSWRNAGKLPLFLTATCEFSRFDMPEIVSAGEEVLLNPVGGGIALLTTTRLVYAGPNHALNERFYEIVFEKDGNSLNYCLGDIMKYTKNKTGAGINKRNFSLLGDPALRLSYPFHSIVTDSVNNKPVSEVADTLQALRRIEIAGYVADHQGQFLDSFNGVIYPVIFDKATVQTTLANDGGPQQVFNVRNNIIYKGKASVIDGRFNFTFFVPKDISYAIGQGKISYYAADSAIDASGSLMNIKVGGSFPDAPFDNEGPEIEVFMNNEHFRTGGITDENPVLYVKMRDEFGINTTGNGIGHDIIGTFNNDSRNSVVLNEYYLSSLNTYQSGTVVYPLFSLPEGPHHIKIKAWDIFNNSSEAETEFIVVKSGDLLIEKLLNYPNPFSTSTYFSFEHNMGGTDLDIRIDIFTTQGELVKTLRAKEFASGFRTQPVEWEASAQGLQGIYIYKLQVQSSTGKEATASGKLVIVKP